MVRPPGAFSVAVSVPSKVPSGPSAMSPCPTRSRSVPLYARVSFAGSGSANFTVQGADPPSDSVPEPTSLFLLGSALLGLGFLPKLGLGFLPKKKLI